MQITIRCPSAHEADVWFQSLHSCCESLLTQALAELNLMLGGNPEVKLMGWLGERVPTVDGTDAWRPVFAALTHTDLLLYEHVPALKSDWAKPSISRPLIATRCAHIHNNI